MKLVRFLLNWFFFKINFVLLWVLRAIYWVFSLSFAYNKSILLLIMVELLMMELFKLKVAITWWGQTARESPGLGFIDGSTWPGSLYGMKEALDGDSGARDLSYSPFLECNILFPSELHVPSVGRDRAAKALLRVDAKIHGIQADDSCNYKCLGSSGQWIWWTTCLK